jgi:hypothetical protein
MMLFANEHGFMLKRLKAKAMAVATIFWSEWYSFNFPIT